MTFGIDDFQALVRLLEQRPEWRAELRRLVLTEELLGLPALVQELARRVADLAEAQQRTEAELRELREGLAELRRAVAGLTEAQHRTNDRLDRHEQHVADLRGRDFERRYREHAGAYFDDIARRARPLSNLQVAALIDEPGGEEQLTRAERRDLLLADLVVRGRRWSDDAEVYLVVEVSAGLGPNDVERAARRAGLLSRLRPALAAVAGAWITPEAESLADERGVWRVLDGRVQAPSEDQG